MLITGGAYLLYFSFDLMHKSDFKMIRSKIVLSALLIILTVNSVFSQDGLSTKDEKSMIEKAEFYFEEGDYQNIPKSLDLFEKLEKNKPEDPYFKLMVGICYSYFKNKKSQSVDKLLKVKEMNSEFNEINKYLGRAYAVNHRFDEAIVAFQEYLTSDELTDLDKSSTRQNIIYCQNAKIYLQDSVSVEIINIGSPINTEHSEYVPVITSDESMIMYTYRGDRSKGGLMGPRGKPDNDGQYYEDIMVSYKFGDDWLEPESIADNINTVGHDASIALSVDGQKLFIYKQTKKDNGDIYVSELNGEEWSKPERLLGDINSEAWEGSASLASDGQTIYFSSDREGGFGDRDLYSATLLSDGTWGEIENLGPTINTKFDDDAPFIHPDRRTMYYSSKGHNSMGGYDIFYTYLNDDGWDEPENIGYPINSIDDDRYYVLSADAKTGYYSTAGRSENGTHDIYTVSPGHFGKRPILALVVGVTQADGEPVEADITVTNDNTGELAGKFKSNSTSGKYMLALTPGNKYKIAIEVEGYETKIDYLDVQSLETYVQVEHDFNLYSKDNIEGTKISDDLDPLQGKIDNQIEKYKIESTEKGYEEMIFSKILKEKGDEKKANVEFFLDGECVNMENEKIKSKVIEHTYPDGSTKKMIGPFATLLESEVFKQDLVKDDSTCVNLETKVADNGNEKTIKQYYPKEFTRKEFIKDASIHDQLTGVDSLTKGNNLDTDQAIGLETNNDINLTDTTGLENAAEKTITGLTFKVEIGAVDDPSDFKLGHLEKYGKITAKIYPDGKTRYTFGPFETLAEAENFRQMLAEKEKASEDAFVTVFVFGQRKVVDEIPEKQREELGIPVLEKNPCGDGAIDFSFFVGKDLNDKSIYNKLIKTGGNSCAEGLEFKVQIAAYRFPKNYKWGHLKQYGEPLVLDYPDGITRFTQGTFNTLKTAEVLRQKIIKSGQKDAWITPFYNGKRMLLEELIKVNFYGRSVN
jgi:WD40-like Beta Propeller Repeat